MRYRLLDCKCVPLGPHHRPALVIESGACGGEATVEEVAPRRIQGNADLVAQARRRGRNANGPLRRAARS